MIPLFSGTRKRQLNCLLVLTDTQPTAFFGCYGTPGTQTHRVDALAKQGVRFDRAYTDTLAFAAVEAE